MAEIAETPFLKNKLCDICDLCVKRRAHLSLHGLHPEGIARHDAGHDRRQPVILFPGPADHRTNLRHIVIPELSFPNAYIISFSVSVRTKRSLPSNNACRSSAGPSIARPFGNTVLASIGPGFEVDRLPSTNRIEVFESETNRIDHAVALPAARFAAMAFEPRPKRPGRLSLGLGQVRVSIGGWRRRRRPHQLAHDPCAAQNRRRAVAVQRPQQHRAFAEQPPPPGIVECDAPELRSHDRGDAIVPREPFVEERVVGREQVADVSIVRQHARDERLELDGHIPPQQLVEGGKQIRIGLHLRELVRIQPLDREVAHQARGARVVQHPKRLGSEHGWVAQPARSRNLEQRLVWPLTPKKERQPRCQLQVGQRELDPLPGILPPSLRFGSFAAALAEAVGELIPRYKNSGLTSTAAITCSIPKSNPPGPLAAFRPRSKYGMRESTSSAVTGRRNARRARFSEMRRAHGSSSFGLPGRQMKIRRRLAVSETPEELNGPTTWTPSTSLAIRSPPAELVSREEADEFIGLDAGALDERHRDVVHAGLDLHGNVGKALHHLGAPRCAAAIDGPHVV